MKDNYDKKNYHIALWSLFVAMLGIGLPAIWYMSTHIHHIDDEISVIPSLTTKVDNLTIGMATIVGALHINKQSGQADSSLSSNN